MICIIACEKNEGLNIILWFYKGLFIKNPLKKKTNKQTNSPIQNALKKKEAHKENHQCDRWRASMIPRFPSNGGEITVSLALGIPHPMSSEVHHRCPGPPLLSSSEVISFFMKSSNFVYMFDLFDLFVHI